MIAGWPDDTWRLAAAARLGDILRPAWDQLPEQADRAPSLLLSARYAVVPFQGRADEIAELERWYANLAAPGLRLVIGAGGAGKTRLAVELCQRMHARGWLTGFLAEDVDASAIDRVRELQEPTLLVLDYAETRGGERLLRQGAPGRDGVGVVGPRTRSRMTWARPTVLPAASSSVAIRSANNLMRGAD